MSHMVFYRWPFIVLGIFFLVGGCLLICLFTNGKNSLYLLLLLFFLSGVFLSLNTQTTSVISSLASKRKKVVIEGLVLEPARYLKNMAKIKVRTHQILFEGQNIRLNEDLIVHIYSHIPQLQPGEKIYFPARLRKFRNFNNPGHYNYKLAMEIKGLSCGASVSDGRYIVSMGAGRLPFPQRYLEYIQRPLREFFQKRLSPNNNNLLRALILGERQGISLDFREPFNRSGLGHIFAVSGLHIGLVAWLSFFLIKKGLSCSYRLILSVDIRKLAAFLTCIPVIGYTSLAGFHLSSQRAMIMALVFLWSIILGRERDLWSSLSLAGIIILFLDPRAIFSISFQFSFIAVIGIFCLSSVILNRLEPVRIKAKEAGRIIGFLFDYFVGLGVVSLSAIIFLIPLSSFYFHRISLVSIPANITVIPILGMWVIPFGLLSCIVYPFSAGVADLLLQFDAFGLGLIMRMVNFWSDLPWSCFWTVSPNIWEVIGLYAILLMLFLRNYIWARKGILILLIILLLDVACWIKNVRFNHDLRVTFLDVGQANAALIEFPGGEKMMIDAGGGRNGNFDMGKMVIAPFLWYSKIKKLDYLVMSHPQSDHMNGLPFLAENFHPKEFWHNGDRVETDTFKRLMTIIEEKKITKLLPEDLAEGRLIGGVRVEMLHPLPGCKAFNSADNRNNNSLVVKISFCGKAFLFPGDLQVEGEEMIVSKKGDYLKSDILLSPHHGSKSSSSKKFLMKVKPQICIISSGEGNPFGFPHRQTLLRLHESGCRIIRLDKSGSVRFTVASHAFSIRTFLDVAY